jgi:DNA-binding response OmpR family regulator
VDPNGIIPTVPLVDFARPHDRGTCGLRAERRAEVKRILIIEDNADVRAFMKLALEMAGYDVSAAENGRHGLDLQREDPAPVVITDIFMPLKDGIETIVEIRKEFPQTRIIAVSGGGEYLNKPEYLWAAREFGAVTTLRKPFGVDELLEAVRKTVAD